MCRENWFFTCELIFNFAYCVVPFHLQSIDILKIYRLQAYKTTMLLKFDNDFIDQGPTFSSSKNSAPNPYKLSCIRDTFYGRF